MLHPYITPGLCMVLYYTPTSWKHMPIWFYVHIPCAEVLDSFLIQISEGLTEWLNHQASSRGCTPSGWLIETTRVLFAQPPARSVNLQAVFNGMSPLRHEPRPCRWTCRQDTSWAERSLRVKASFQLTRTKESLRWSILKCRNKPAGEWDRKRLMDTLTKKVTKEEGAGRTCWRDEKHKWSEREWDWDRERRRGNSREAAAAAAAFLCLLDVTIMEICISEKRHSGPLGPKKYKYFNNKHFQCLPPVTAPGYYFSLNAVSQCRILYA